MVGYSASSGAVPYLVRTLVDDVLTRAEPQDLRMLPGMILGVFLLRALMDFGQTYFGEFVGQRIVFDLRKQLNERVQRLPVGFFERSTSAGIVSRMTTDVLALRQALTEGAAAMLRDASSVTVLIVVACYLDFPLAVIAFVVFPAVVVPLQWLSRRMRELSHSGLASLGSLSSLLHETIVGSRIVKAFNMEAYEERRFDHENGRLLGTYLRAARLKALTAPMTEIASAVAVAGIVWFGGESVVGGERTAGGLIAFLTAIALLYEPFKKLVRTNNLVQTGLGAAERIFELLDEPVEDPASGAIVVDGFRQEIRLEGVCFSYGRAAALKGVDLVVHAGEVVALVGPSGGGKSTIADLLPRFYDAAAGEITFDGIPLREIDTESLRTQIAVVPQVTFLFNDTIRNNIAYGRVDADRASVERAAVAAHAHEFIAEMPAGYDTVVGEMGVQLSAGQRQRIAIARALLKDAPILILDEATSSLDAQSERLVQEAVERLMQGRTTLVIAHRLATVRRATRIAVVDGGRVVESGTHDELLASGALYRRLYELQLDDKAAVTDDRAA
jgi:subfamily B ATP-binding cassette protein MsbA